MHIHDRVGSPFHLLLRIDALEVLCLYMPFDPRNLIYQQFQPFLHGLRFDCSLSAECLACSLNISSSVERDRKGSQGFWSLGWNEGIDVVVDIVKLITYPDYLPLQPHLILRLSLHKLIGYAFCDPVESQNQLVVPIDILKVVVEVYDPAPPLHHWPLLEDFLNVSVGAIENFVG